MLTVSQIEQFSRKIHTNATIVVREYLQLLFIQNFYELPESKKIFFKGGTAIHFLLEGFRFSEDLDFTSGASLTETHGLVLKTVKNLQHVVSGLTFKEKKTVAGKSYLLTLEKGMVNFPIFVRLDISFREKILQKERKLIDSEFPVIFNSFVHYMGAEEILAEKTRAILTRNKGRDLFDCWFLLAKGYQLDEKLIKLKMNYYPKENFSWKKVLEKVDKYDFVQFKSDLMPFLPLDKRGKIQETFEIVKNQISNRIKQIAPSEMKNRSGIGNALTIKDF